MSPDALDTDHAWPLARIGVTGVAGLPNIELELRRLTALVGPRASGKSQLLRSVAWLLRGRPRPRARAGGSLTRVTGELQRGDRTILVVRQAGHPLSVRPAGRGGSSLPRASFLEARARFSPLPASGGTVADRLSAASAGHTTDAAVAEALVAVIESCCDDCVTGEVLIVEEPELLLTPQAQRYLYRLLRRFADGGNQVIYSTRSPAFVDAAHHEEIVRLDLRSRRRTLRTTEPHTLSDPERVRLAAEFDHERSEMFFARIVVLVEGQTERLSLPFVFRTLGHDPDAEGTAIVEVGGKSNLSLAARLLRQLGIPFVIVFDADSGTASATLDAEIVLAAGGAPVFRLVPDFEAAAGIVAHTDKVWHAWQRFSGAVPDDVPLALGAIIRATVP